MAIVEIATVDTVMRALADPTRRAVFERIASGEEITVDLRDESYVTAVRLELGPLPMEYPRAMAVDCAGSDGSWQTCWTGSPAAAALTAALQDPRTMPITLFIGRTGVRRLRLRQLGTDPVNAWAIAELSVYGAPVVARSGRF